MDEQKKLKELRQGIVLAIVYLFSKRGIKEVKRSELIDCLKKLPEALYAFNEDLPYVSCELNYDIEELASKRYLKKWKGIRNGEIIGKSTFLALGSQGSTGAKNVRMSIGTFERLEEIVKNRRTGY